MDSPIRKNGRGMSNHERFWQYVDKQGPDECWEWTGSRNKETNDKGADTYGRFTLFPPEVPKKRRMNASRASYILHHGKEPEGLVLHHCDNPPCVNPAHLYEGTHKDNARDRDSRGRHGRDTPGYRNRKTWSGDKNGNSTLATEEVKEIRLLYATGNYRLQDLANTYGVNKTTIGRVVRREMWAHVD